MVSVIDKQFTFEFYHCNFSISIRGCLPCYSRCSTLAALVAFASNCPFCGSSSYKFNRSSTCCCTWQLYNFFAVTSCHFATTPITLAGTNPSAVSAPCPVADSYDVKETVVAHFALATSSSSGVAPYFQAPGIHFAAVAYSPATVGHVTGADHLSHCTSLWGQRWVPHSKVQVCEPCHLVVGILVGDRTGIPQYKAG